MHKGKNGPLTRPTSIQGRITGVAVFTPPSTSPEDWAHTKAGLQAKKAAFMAAIHERPDYAERPWMGVIMRPHKSGYRYWWTVEFTWK